MILDFGFWRNWGAPRPPNMTTSCPRARICAPTSHSKALLRRVPLEPHRVIGVDGGVFLPVAQGPIAFGAPCQVDSNLGKRGGQPVYQGRVIMRVAESTAIRNGIQHCATSFEHTPH